MGTNLSAALTTRSELGPDLRPEACETTREVIRCAHCQLTQFRTQNGHCRRCSGALDQPPPVVVLAPVQPATDELVLPDFAGAIRHRRRGLGWSQRQLAERMNVPRTYVSKIENDKATPTVASLERMANALSTDIATLLQCSGGGSPGEMAALMRDGFIRDLTLLAPRLAPAQMQQLLLELRQRTRPH